MIPDPADYYMRGESPMYAPPSAGAAAAFHGARMVGNINSGGGGSIIVMPTNTGSYEFNEDVFVAVSYDVSGFTTGHGLADGRFVIPADGHYRVTAHPLFVNIDPGASGAYTLFHAWLAIDGDHGFPSVSDPRRVWAVDYQLNFGPSNTKSAFWAPCLTMTEEFTAGEEVSVFGRFDGGATGSFGWAGMISFEIERRG